MYTPVSPFILGLLSIPLRSSEVLWPAFTYSKFVSLCFLLGSSHHCVVKFTDRFPCNEQSTSNPSLLDLISDATALLSNVHPVFCVFSESSLKILEHMGHSYGNLIFPSVNPNIYIISGFVLVDWWGEGVLLVAGHIFLFLCLSGDFLIGYQML